MPIRFRCFYCKQLMAIAKRKAGAVVRCPKCAGEIEVPSPEEETGPPEDVAEPPAPFAFEDPKFEHHFPAADAPAPAVETSPVATAPPQVEEVPEPTPPSLAPSAPLGVFLPLGVIILCFFVIVLLLIVVFLMGLIIGMKSAGTSEAKTAALLVQQLVLPGRASA